MSVTQAEIEAAKKAARAVEHQFGITIDWRLREALVIAALKSVNCSDGINEMEALVEK